MAQLVFRVSGQSLTSWSTAPHSLAEEHSNWDIVDFVCRMPGGTKVQMGNYDSILALSSLRYFAWFGTNSLQDMTDMFSYCTSLLSVRGAGHHVGHGHDRHVLQLQHAEGHTGHGHQQCHQPATPFQAAAP